MLAAASIAIAVSGIVAALAAHADLVDGSSAADPARTDRLGQVLLVITVTLVALAAVNAIFITWATALDARHSSALARALGATPQQVSADFGGTAASRARRRHPRHPGGIGLVAAVDPDSTTLPPLWQLLAVVPATVLVVARPTAIPARIGARRPAAEILRSELRMIVRTSSWVCSAPRTRWGSPRPLGPKASARARSGARLLGTTTAADVQASGRRRDSSVVSVASAVTRSSDDLAAWSSRRWAAAKSPRKASILPRL